MQLFVTSGGDYQYLYINVTSQYLSTFLSETLADSLEKQHSFTDIAGRRNRSWPNKPEIFCFMQLLLLVCVVPWWQGCKSVSCVPQQRGSHPHLSRWNVFVWLWRRARGDGWISAYKAKVGLCALWYSLSNACLIALTKLRSSVLSLNSFSLMLFSPSDSSSPIR